jgi:hypothetical protein
VKLPTGVDRELFFERFGSEVRLREVIVGPLCGEDVAALHAKVNSLHSGVTTFKARLADKFFSVVPDEPTVPPRTVTSPSSVIAGESAGRSYSGRRKEATGPG